MVIICNSICFSFLITVYLVTAVTNRLKGLYFWWGSLDWQLLPANSRTSFGGSNTKLIILQPREVPIKLLSPAGPR